MKYGIDYGHCLTGADTGSIGNELKEQEVTRDIGRRVTSKLRASGHTVYETYTDSSNTVVESLAHRVNIANSNSVHMFISIHVNAGGGRGTEVFTYNGEEVSEAKNILNNICNLGFNTRGIKDGSSLYVIRNTRAKAILVEVFFIDTDDASKYKNIGAENVANAIVRGLVGQTVSTFATPVQCTLKPQNNNWVARLQSECNRQGFSSQVVDGFLGRNTLAGCPTIRFGAKGNITRLLQERLGVGSDGIFGNNTLKAVIHFQKAHGLSADGIIGENTWKKLLGL